MGTLQEISMEPVTNDQSDLVSPKSPLTSNESPLFQAVLTNSTHNFSCQPEKQTLTSLFLPKKSVLKTHWTQLAPEKSLSPVITMASTLVTTSLNTLSTTKKLNSKLNTTETKCSGWPFSELTVLKF